MLQYAIWKNGLAGLLIEISVILAMIVGCKNIHAKIFRIVILFVISSSVGLGMSACGVKTTTVQPSDSISQTTLLTSTPEPLESGINEKKTPTDINQEMPRITEQVISSNVTIENKCIEEITELGENKNISGSIVLYVNNGGIYYNLILFDTETREITEITPHYFENTTHTLFLNGLSVSPDGGYLAYQTSYFVGEEESAEYIGNKIKIINAKNEKITEINNLYPTTHFKWLDNDFLLIHTSQDRNPLILTDISSGNQTYLYPILGKEIVDTDNISAWVFFEMHKNVYNSDLSRVVYPSAVNGESAAIMRNMENDSDITIIPTKFGWGTSPVWSQDGNFLAIAVADDRNRTEDNIFVFDRNGEIIFQTDQSSTNMLEYIYRMSWSPNSKFLAINYYIGKSSDLKYFLEILDIEERKIITYCAPNVYPSIPYWSPDNQYLLYPSQPTDSDEMKSYILNLETGQNYLVMDGYFPGGWMK